MAIVPLKPFLPLLIQLFLYFGFSMALLYFVYYKCIAGIGMRIRKSMEPGPKSAFRRKGLGLGLAPCQKCSAQVSPTYKLLHCLISL